MDAEPPKWLKILCFGDSLTAGYTMWGTEHYPYADILHVHLKRLLPSTNIVIDVAGLSGDQVVPPRGNFINRMESRIKKAAGAAVPYDWVIVLGGTNDLGWSREPEDIYHALRTTWQIALDAGAKVLALSVPECEAQFRDIIEKRKKLNQLIAKHEADRWFYMDLCDAVPFFSMDKKLREEIWDDGLHLTRAGYKMMGNAISARMIELLSGERNDQL